MARFWARRQPPATAATRTTEEQVETVPPPQPRPFWPWLLLLLAVVLGAIAASWYFTTRDDTVEAAEVPSVVGLQRDDAERRIEERGFETEVKRVVSTRPVGTVVAQRPNPGTKYGKGGIVVISVARDPLKVDVPDVTGLPVAQAQARLRAAELIPRAQNVASRQPKGRVLRQVPAAGTEVPKDSPVVIIVSAGPQLVEVPDVVGLSTEEATAQLARVGFRTRVQQVAGTEPEGTVIAQEPLGGTRAQRGRVVRIDVSRGQTQTTTTVVTTTTGPSQGTVPDTVGQDEQSATLTLEDAGYRFRVTNRTVTDPSEDGIVLQQIPRGGTRRTGSTVTIVVGRLQ
jgi:beta-lactam-binding protein with PASTA domain